MTIRRMRPLVLAAVIVSGAPLSAHDMWIEPATFFPEPGQIVAVGLRVGQDLLGVPMEDRPTFRRWAGWSTSRSRPVWSAGTRARWSWWPGSPA